VAAVLVFVVFRKQIFGLNLRHTAVEQWIETNKGASDVVCNGGNNIKVENGKRFTCTAAGGQTYVVTMTSDDGDYTVQP
jgi:hypothetical protein